MEREFLIETLLGAMGVALVLLVPFWLLVLLPIGLLSRKGPLGLGTVVLVMFVGIMLYLAMLAMLGFISGMMWV